MVALYFASAVLGAAIGFLGSGGVRLFLDRRQELVAAQAFARVMRDELLVIDRILEFLLEDRRLQSFIELPADQWRAHRSAIAAKITSEEFLAVSTAYRAIDALNALLARQEVGRLPQSLLEEITTTRTIVEQIAAPSIEWLAEGQKNWRDILRTRRASSVLVQWPQARCVCNHRLDVHRWEFRRRRVRLRRRSERMIEVAHECNVVECRCGYFRWGKASRWNRPLRRWNLLPQSSYIEDPPSEPKFDHRFPPAAQLEARVDLAKHEVELANGEIVPLHDNSGLQTQPSWVHQGVNTGKLT